MNMDPWGGMDAEIIAMKAWKNARKMGKIRIKAAEIHGPTDDIRAREFDPAHCAVGCKPLGAPTPKESSLW